VGNISEKLSARSSTLQLRRRVSVPYRMPLFDLDRPRLARSDAAEPEPGEGTRCAGVRGSRSRPSRISRTSSRKTLLSEFFSPQ
jgi:hypothetical protein